MNPISLKYNKLFETVGLVILTILLSGCLKNEFTINVSLPEDINTTYRISYYGAASKGGIAMDAAIAVAAGKGNLKGYTRYPTVVSLFSGQNQLPSIAIYAERGDDIKIIGSEADPLGWEVKGNKPNELLTEWRLANRSALEKVINPSGDNSYEVRKALNKAIESFVEKNQKSVASLILLGIYYDSVADLKGFKRLYDLLDKSGVIEDYPNLIPRQDLLTDTEIIPVDGGGKKLTDIVVKSYVKNIDTLRLASGNHPTLMYFWRRSDIERREDVDSLKRIAGWSGDSVKMGIADFCLDSDSTSWTYPIKSDSLKNTLHAWVPRGFADRDLMKMGVAGTPWWIVTDSKGRVLYSGDDRTKALPAFRKLKK
ncbi:MAG: hypothetical protein K2M31_08640 [Muribaculaceae bacterium]|nr:hypothetical protein [Muribaculaceae bacterium]